MADPAALSSFLARAVADAREDAERRAAKLPLDAIKEAATAAPPPRGFRAALSQSKPGVALIAEIKRRSPSRGDIRPDLDPAALARAYQRGGAAAVSILTEPRHFAGSPTDLRAAHAATALLTALLTETAAAGLDALVEVHTRAEAETAAASGATLVGINARDLATLGVDPGRFAAVRDVLAGEVTVVAESGIHDRAGVLAVASAGADAVLVGESLVRARDPAAAAAALLGRKQ